MTGKCSDCRHSEFIMDYICERVFYCHNKGNTAIYDSDGARKRELDMRELFKVKDPGEDAVILEKWHCPFFE